MTSIAEMTKDLARDDDCWLEDGRKCYFLAALHDMILVRPIMRPAEDDYGFGDYDGPIEAVQRIFKEPPVALYDQKIAEMQGMLDDLSAQYDDMTNKVRHGERDIAARLLRIKALEPLKNIEAFIEGRLNYFVVKDCKSGEHISVVTKDEAIIGYGRYDGELKLLSLFGKSKGNLSWKLNNYFDGSGGNTEVWPFASHDDAIAHAKGMLIEAADKIIALDATKAHKGYLAHIENVMRSALVLHVELPPAVAVSAHTARRALADETMIRAHKAMAEAQALMGDPMIPPEAPHA
jgi:hypothetical protein